MDITEFFKTNNEVQVYISRQENGMIRVITTTKELSIVEDIDGDFIPGTIEQVWFKQLDKIIEKQNEVANPDNS